MPASYSLGPHFEDLIRRQVRSGRFASASEVVREGLRLIEVREAEREARLEAVRNAVARGRDSGPGIPADEAFARAQITTGKPEARKKAAGRAGCKSLTPASVLKRLRAHEPELRRLGISRLLLFGSVARGEARPDSDVDLAAEFDPAAEVGMFKYGAIAHRLERMLGVKVDLVGMPARTHRMQVEIDRDQVHVY